MVWAYVYRYSNLMPLDKCAVLFILYDALYTSHRVANVNDLMDTLVYLHDVLLYTTIWLYNNMVYVYVLFFLCNGWWSVGGDTSRK